MSNNEFRFNLNDIYKPGIIKSTDNNHIIKTASDMIAKSMPRYHRAHPEFLTCKILTVYKNNTFDVQSLDDDKTYFDVPSITPGSWVYYQPGQAVHVRYYNVDSNRMYIRFGQGFSGPDVLDPFIGAVISVGQWLQAEGFSNISYGLPSITLPLWFVTTPSIPSPVVMATIYNRDTEANIIAAGGINPRGTTIFTFNNPLGKKVTVATSYTMLSGSGVSGYIQEVVLSGDPTITNFVDFLQQSFTYPATEDFIRSATGVLGNERRQGYLFVDPAGEGWYTICAESGIGIINRSLRFTSGSNPVWSSWATASLEHSGDSFVYKDGTVRSPVLRTGSIACDGIDILECSFSEYIQAFGDDRAKHSALQLYQRQADATVSPTYLLSLASLLGDKARIFGCGGIDRMVETSGFAGPRPVNMPSARWPLLNAGSRREWWVSVCSMATGSRGYFHLVALDLISSTAVIKRTIEPPTMAWMDLYTTQVSDLSAVFSASYNTSNPSFVGYFNSIAGRGFDSASGLWFNTQGAGQTTFAAPDGSYVTIAGYLLETTFWENGSVYDGIVDTQPLGGEYFYYPFLADWDDSNLPLVNYGEEDFPKYPQRACSGIIDGITHFTVIHEKHQMTTGLVVPSGYPTPRVLSHGGVMTAAYTIFQHDWKEHLLGGIGAPDGTWEGPGILNPSTGSYVDPHRDYTTYSVSGGNITGSTYSPSGSHSFDISHGTTSADSWVVSAQAYKAQRTGQPVYKTFLLSTGGDANFQLDITQYCKWVDDGSGSLLKKADKYPYLGSIWQIAVTDNYLWILRQAPWALTGGVFPGGHFQLSQREPCLELRQKSDGKLIQTVALHPPSDLPARDLVYNYDHLPHMHVGYNYDVAHRKNIPWAHVWGQWMPAGDPSFANARHSRTKVIYTAESTIYRQDDLTTGKVTGIPTTLEARTLAISSDNDPVWIDDGTHLVKSGHL